MNEVWGADVAREQAETASRAGRDRLGAQVERLSKVISLLEDRFDFVLLPVTPSAPVVQSISEVALPESGFSEAVAKLGREVQRIDRLINRVDV